MGGLMKLKHDNEDLLTYCVVFKELFVPILEEVQLWKSNQWILLFVYLSVCFPHQIVRLWSSVGREFSMEHDQRIFGHQFFNFLFRGEELLVNLVGGGHVDRSSDVSPFELIFIPAVNNNQVGSAPISIFHFRFQKIFKL